MTELLTRIFVKDRTNISSPRVRAAYGTLVSVTGILLNLLLFAGKITVGLLFASIAIVSDAINNLTDAGTQIISLFSFRISARPADREHPFGHARIEYVCSMIVSFLILYIGIQLLSESVGKILHPVPPEPSLISVGVLAASVCIKLWLAFFNHKIGKKIDSAVMRATATDSLSDVLSTGVILLVTVLTLIFPPLRALNLDAYMGAIVSVMILVAGLRILNDSKNAILGEAPADEIVSKITETVKNHPDALGIHDLIVHNYGPGHIIAALHIEVDGKEDIFKTHDMIDNIERELRENGIEATIHMDPIVTDDERVNALRQMALEAVRSVDPSLDIHDFRFVEGHTHTNLIFDVRIPFEVRKSDAEIRDAICAAIKKENPSFFAVLTLDRG